MNKLIKKLICLFVIVSCFTLFTVPDLCAAEKWWTVTVDTVTVKTSPSLQYVAKVTNINGPWTYYLNFTNKEMLATLLTAKSLDTNVVVKFNDSTFELLQINL